MILKHLSNNYNKKVSHAINNIYCMKQRHNFSVLELETLRFLVDELENKQEDF